MLRAPEKTTLGRHSSLLLIGLQWRLSTVVRFMCRMSQSVADFEHGKERRKGENESNSPAAVALLTAARIGGGCRLIVSNNCWTNSRRSP